MIRLRMMLTNIIYLMSSISLVLLFTIKVSSAAIIDFESAASAPNGGIFNGNPYAEDNFNISTTSNGINVLQDNWQFGRGSSNGTNVGSIFSATLSATFSLNKITGDPFSLISIDVAELFNVGDVAQLASAKDLSITGFINGGGTISTSYTLDGLSDGAGSVNDFESIIFDDNWGNLLTVDFNALNASNNFGTYIAFDNITAGSPILSVASPDVFFIFGLGLIAIMLTRKNRGRL